MKKALLLSALLAGLTPLAAKAEPACGLSYTILPDGYCMDMSYLTRLTATRRGIAAVNAEVQEEFDRNVAIEMIPDYEETEEERDDRYRRLAEMSLAADELNATQESLEARAFVLHGLMLDVFRDAYNP